MYTKYVERMSEICFKVFQQKLKEMNKEKERTGEEKGIIKQMWQNFHDYLNLGGRSWENLCTNSLLLCMLKIFHNKNLS